MAEQRILPVYAMGGVFGVDAGEVRDPDGTNPRDAIVISTDRDGQTVRYVMTVDDATYLRDQLTKELTKVS